MSNYNCDTASCRRAPIFLSRRSPASPDEDGSRQFFLSTLNFYPSPADFFSLCTCVPAYLYTYISPIAAPPTMNFPHVPFTAFAKGDRFARARKVMVRRITRLLARGYGFLDGILEIAPMVIPQQRLQVPCTPVFSAIPIDLFQFFE